MGVTTLVTRLTGNFYESIKKKNHQKQQIQNKAKPNPNLILQKNKSKTINITKANPSNAAGRKTKTKANKKVYFLRSRLKAFHNTTLYLLGIAPRILNRWMAGFEHYWNLVHVELAQQDGKNVILFQWWCCLVTGDGVDHDFVWKLDPSSPFLTSLDASLPCLPCCIQVFLAKDRMFKDREVAIKKVRPWGYQTWWIPLSQCWFYLASSHITISS